MMPENGILGWDGYGYGSGMGIFGWLFMLAFWGLFMVGAVGVARWLRLAGQSGEGTRPGDARTTQAELSTTDRVARSGSN